MITTPSARKVLFDTNVYLDAIQGGPNRAAYQLLFAALPRTSLSAVVVQELCAGAMDTMGERLVAQFVRRTEETGRIAVPTYGDWKEAGRILARIGRREPAERTRVPRLVNDVLLALSARQIGATLYTFNRDDFLLIARYLKFGLEIL